MAPADGKGNRWFTTAASLAVGSSFFALWFWLLPRWLGFRVEMAGVSVLEMARGGSVNFGIRGCIALHMGFRMERARHACSLRFRRSGWSWSVSTAIVRNPMYVGFAVGWIGLWIVFGTANLETIVGVFAVAVGVHLFVIFYEEPTCATNSVPTTMSNCRNVRRWWPGNSGVGPRTYGAGADHG